MTAKTPEQIERRRQVRARCYAKHREQNLAYAEKYRAENAERIREAQRGRGYSKTYRQRHPEKSRAISAAWKAANPERRKATQAAYLQNNLERNRAHQQNRRARKANAGGRLSPGIAERLFQLQRGRCACCRMPLGNDYELDHIVPLVMGGSNTDDNIQLLTATCNRRKGAKDPIEFMQGVRGMLL